MPSRSARAQPYPYSTQKRSWNHECTRIGTYKYFMFNHLSSLTPQGTIRFNFARLATHKIATPSPTSCPFVVSKTEPKPTADSRLMKESIPSGLETTPCTNAVIVHRIGKAELPPSPDSVTSTSTTMLPSSPSMPISPHSSFSKPRSPAIPSTD